MKANPSEPMAAAAPSPYPLPDLSPAQIRQAWSPEDQQCDGAAENRRRDNPVSEEELLWLWLCSCPGSLEKDRLEKQSAMGFFPGCP